MYVENKSLQVQDGNVSSKSSLYNDVVDAAGTQQHRRYYSTSNPQNNTTAVSSAGMTMMHPTYTTPVANKRQEMLRKYKDALAKREEARLELEKLEKEATIFGVPLFQDYAKDPLVLRLQLAENPPASTIDRFSRTRTRVVPAFKDQVGESERVFMIPQTQQQSLVGFPNVVTSMQDQQSPPLFMVTNNKMAQEADLYKQQRTHQQQQHLSLLYQQQQQQHMLPLEHNTGSPGIMTMRTAPLGVAQMKNVYSQQSFLASNVGSRAVRSVGAASAAQTMAGLSGGSSFGL